MEEALLNGDVVEEPPMKVVKTHVYWKFIDGLRGIAVLLVLLFHLEIHGFSVGYIGVDVFFVISGFLVTQTNLDAANHGKFSLGNFYFRRMRRLFPELYVVLICTTCVTLLLGTTNGLLGVAKSGLAQAFFAANIWFWSKVNYFDTTASTKPLLHCWSLSVEEQFYLCYSLCLRVFWRVPERLRLWGVCGVSLCSASYFLWCQKDYPSFAFFSLPTRLWEPLCGAIVALYIGTKHIEGDSGTSSPTRTPRHQLHSVTLNLISISSLLCLFGTVVMHKAMKEHSDSLVNLVPVISSTLFIYFNARQDMPSYVARMLTIPPLVWLGNISYSLYLWHWPMICFFRCFYTFTRPLVPFSVLVILILLISVLSDRFIGLPLRRKPLNEWSKLAVLVPLLYVCFTAVLVPIELGKISSLPTSSTPYAKSTTTTISISPKMQPNGSQRSKGNSNHVPSASRKFKPSVPVPLNLSVLNRYMHMPLRQMKWGTKPKSRKLEVMPGGGAIAFTYNKGCVRTLPNYGSFPIPLKSGANIGSCGYCGKNDSWTLLALGDSQGWTLIQGNKVLANVTEKTCIILLTAPGCFPGVDMTLRGAARFARPCEAFMREVRKFIGIKKKTIDAVLMIGRWKFYITAMPIDPSRVPGVTKAMVANVSTRGLRNNLGFRMGILHMLKYLSPLPVVFMGQVPDFNADSGREVPSTDANALCWENLSCERGKGKSNKWKERFARPKTRFSTLPTNTFLQGLAERQKIILIDPLPVDILLYSLKL